MNAILKFPDSANPCAECGVPITSATAEGREDGLYCDRCLTAIVDLRGIFLRRGRAWALEVASKLDIETGLNLRALVMRWKA